MGSSNSNRNKGFSRRGFLAGTALAGFAIAAPGLVAAQGQKPFNLKYAPHPGQFKNLAGEDIVDQIHFAADQGFTAWEDNKMKNREISEQKRIAAALQERGMQMGVFVASKIRWKNPSLTTGEAEFREEFLQNIRDSVEVAKRVNATWMTVVPGHVTAARQWHIFYFHTRAGNLIDNRFPGTQRSACKQGNAHHEARRAHFRCPFRH